jgi:hypothetical protein
MGHMVKMQSVDRGRTRSFYLNFPAVLADVMQVDKGESFEWLLEDKNTVWLRRVKAKARRRPPASRREAL